MPSRVTPPRHQPVSYHPRPSGGRVRVKERLYRILEQPDASDRLAKAWNLAIVAAITISTLAVIAETVDSVSRQFQSVLMTIEVASLALFGTEYLLLLWVITCSPRYS